MAIPVRLSRKLHETLGTDAGGDLVTWLDEVRAENARFRRDFLAMEARIDERFARIDERFDRIDVRFDRIDLRFAKVEEKLATVPAAIAESRAELMKWMLVFWVGAVGAIAALAGVLRQ